MSRKKRHNQGYSGYFDIAPMVREAESRGVCFVIAVSEDKQRGAGKTYSSARLLMQRYQATGERCVILCRRVKEMGDLGRGIFGGYVADTMPGAEIKETLHDGIFSEIQVIKHEGKKKNRETIGFVVPLYNAGKIKQYRGLFKSARVWSFYFDEFMPLDGKYLRDETGPHGLMKTIYDTVNGDMQWMPIIMTANTISLGNPYFKMLGINNKIQTTTRRLVTDGCIFENVRVAGLAERHTTSAANIAFGATGADYANNVWIGDADSLVAKPDGWGRGFYLATLCSGGERFGLREYMSAGLMYVSRSVEACSYEYNLDASGDLRTPLLASVPLLRELESRLYKGEVRVSDGEIQRILLDTL